MQVEGDQLRSRREDEEPLLLVPLSRTVFASETNDPVRVEFVGDAGGHPLKVFVSNGTGNAEEGARTP